MQSPRRTDAFIARQNIERFRRYLVEARDSASRETIIRLLAETYDRLERAEASDREKSGHAIHVETRQPSPDGSDSVSVIVERLERESDPSRRLSLRRNLVAEEDAFGKLSQQIDLADGHIERGGRHVAQLKALADGPHPDEDTRRRHASNLANAIEIMALFTTFRAGLAVRAAETDL